VCRVCCAQRVCWRRLLSSLPIRTEKKQKKKNCKKSNLTRFFFVHESIILSVELIAPDALSSVLSLCSAAFFVGGKKRMRFV
jgi:hypothetical protein